MWLLQKLDLVHFLAPLELGQSSSDSKAFEGFKSLSNVITPSEDTTILSMKGADFLVNGTSLYSVLLNVPLIDQLVLMPFQNLTLQLHPPSSPPPPPHTFLRIRIACLSFFTIYITVEVSGICFYITYQVIHIKQCWFLMSAFISLLKDLNWVWSLSLPVFLALAWILCKGLKGAASIPTDDLISPHPHFYPTPQLGAVEIMTHWFFRHPLQELTFARSHSSLKQSDIGMSFQIRLFSPLKVQRMVWLGLPL